MLIWLVAAALAEAPVQDVPTIDLAEEADLHFRLGVEAYKASDFRSALDHLLQSQRLAPNPNTAFNVARCYEQLDRPDQAWRYYVAALPDEAVDEALARLDPKVARVVVTSEPPGATVHVDRRDLGVRGVTPLALALSPGDHVVLLSLDGHTPAEVPVTLELGAQVDAGATLEPLERDEGPDWVRSTVRAGDLVVLHAEPGVCEVLPDLLDGAAAWVEPEQRVPGPQPGSIAALAAHTPLALDVVVGNATTRLTLQRPDKKAAWLTDAAPLRAWILDRCRITDAGAVQEALQGLPKATRLEATAVLAELR